MRLLNTKNLRFKEVFEAYETPYCILSHRWAHDLLDEVSYADAKNGDWKLDKSGGSKIKGVCDLAHRLGHEWIWIDTCCIDKTSSSELTESINSMFSWYSDAQTCIAYLSDIEGPELRTSIWFTRGWTLQELLAPKEVVFYDKNFRPIGSKLTNTEEIADITGIPIDYLTGKLLVRQASIARRMSWASRRTVSRKEDEAYCLLGLFDVNMIANYGEKGQAFIRLQKQLLADDDDESIFAWRRRGAKYYHTCGIFAESPRDFEFSQDFEPALSRPNDCERPHRWTNRGVEITRNPWTGNDVPLHVVRLPLRCQIGREHHVAMDLIEACGRWLRIGCDNFNYINVGINDKLFAKVETMQTLYIYQPLRLDSIDFDCVYHEINGWTLIKGEPVKSDSPMEMQASEGAVNSEYQT